MKPTTIDPPAAPAPWAAIPLPAAIRRVLDAAPSVVLANTIEDLSDLACGGRENREWTVRYTLPDGREVVEATVVRVKNGIAANYVEPYMRRRDPDCMVIGDARPSDKPRFAERFGEPFARLRGETLDWLAAQDLAVLAFEIGQPGTGGDALAICPANAGFFAFGLGLLQGVIDLRALDRPFKPSTVILLAPPFRHTRFDGRQIVVHNRAEVHEIFAYNLYPGPSAKKGIYGALIHQGTDEGWITAHCSAVQVITPYDNQVTIMHEGASGGGKSEMLQQPHRLADGRIVLGKNLVTGEERYLEIPRTCDLHPVCDDMGLCHPDYQEKNGKLWLMDGENGWFLRVNHIEHYGTDHDLERLTVAPSKPLLFLNVDVVAGGTALIWEHVEDAPGEPCPNPRVIVPRQIVPGVVNEKVSVDIRSFGVRTPPCTAESPSYGILGLFHLLPPSLAWLWRLVAPRGYANPSVVGGDTMGSEGVGSYWPFATGRRVDQANLLLQQFQAASRTIYILTPNQHVGAWRTGFMPQWLARDYLARRGHAKFKSDQIEPSRCPLLGYSLRSMRIEGTLIPRWFLQVETQPEVGPEAYDQGAVVLTEFFHDELRKYLQPDLSPLARQIIHCCLAGGAVADYAELIPSE
ncbi:MAG TPA: DUF4914 family protein [Thermoguttaceae bacterium]|nr:DUF4914 family protein [Thermoguttaceae bacterium]